MMHVWPPAGSFASHESAFPLAKTADFWTKKKKDFFFFAFFASFFGGGYLFAVNSTGRDQQSSARSLVFATVATQPAFRGQNRRLGAQMQPMQGSPGMLLILFLQVT